MIEAIDDSGAVIHRFPSQKAAEKKGFNQGAVSLAIKTGRRHKGLRWRRAGQAEVGQNGQPELYSRVIVGCF